MWQALSAGGPMNSAVALGKLGADVHFLGRLSNDAFGAQLRRHILRSNVALDLATESSQATSIAVVSLDDEGVASYTFHFANTANFGWQIDDLPQLGGGRLAAHRLPVLRGEPRSGGAAGLDADRDRRASPTTSTSGRRVITDPEVYWSRVQPWLRAVGARGGIVKASDEDISFLGRAAAGGGDPVALATQWVEQYGLGHGRAHARSGRWAGHRARWPADPGRRLPDDRGRHRRGR